MPHSPDPSAGLVADDEPEVREIAAGLFESLGRRVHLASSGAEALASLAAHPEIGLVFSDVRMPEMSGLELAAEVGRRRPDLRVVLTSGYIGEGIAEDPAILRKPWRLGDLARLLPSAP